jgi:uncharacterized protein YkwD
MFKLILKNKSYLLLIVMFFFSACGSSESLNGGTVSSYTKISYEEEKTLNQIGTNQQALLDAINYERSQRRSCGDRGTFGPSQPLTWNTSLYASALEHVMDLANSDTFSHDGSGTEYDITGDGRPSRFYERIVRNGYRNYHTVGENIAGGQRTLKQVMKAWMASPRHCENIMKPNYKEVGVAIVINQSSSYQVYWGQNFGTKR